MESDAEMLGIDIAKLEQERWGTADHYRLMRMQRDRVRAYDISRRYIALETRMAELAEADREAVIEKVEQRNRKRRERKYGRKPDSDYEFSEEQLEIAIRSLSRHAESSYNKRMV